LLRASNRPEDRLAREPARLNAILNEVRARGYGIRNSMHAGGYYGGPPHSDGLFSISVPLRDGSRVLGAMNMLWLKNAFSIEAFAARHLGELQNVAAEIVSSVRRRRKR
jgi:IclR family transcriptional regulator, mhp operon transcriptional activator